MRRVVRSDLEADSVEFLTKKQLELLAEGADVNITARWKSARQAKNMEGVLQKLQLMMGPLQRCMYCVDSHGCDIEHFYPKAHYADRVFLWANLLLCCTECGRLKGNGFPLNDLGLPLLIDPSSEEPWDNLDFDPNTGNVMARYFPETETKSAKGLACVKLLGLARREGMAEGYKRTYRRLVKVMMDFVESPCNVEALIFELRENDSHGLLGWFFKGRGMNQPVVVEIKERYPDVWQSCVEAFQYQ